MVTKMAKLVKIVLEILDPIDGFPILGLGSSLKQ